jgi:phosphinothricin acetyltransferase
MIRAAEAGDAEAIAALWNWMIRDTLATFTTVEKTPADIVALIAGRPGAFLVAEDPGGVCGFATFGPFRAGPGYVATCEHSILIRPETQGRGLGRALMCDLEALATAHAMHAMIGGVSGANPAAVRFHAACGFVETGRLPEVGRKAGQWLDLGFMQKILGGGT